MVPIGLPALDRLPRCQGAEMIASGDRIAGSADAARATGAGHLRGIYGVEAIRAAMIAAADRVAVVVIGVRAGEEVSLLCRVLRHNIGPPVAQFSTADDPDAEDRQHREAADQGLVVVGDHLRDMPQFVTLP